MLVEPAWTSNIIVYMYKSKNFFLVRDSGNASFPQTKKMSVNNINLVNLQQFIKKRFILLVYIMDTKGKKWYEFSTWPQEHRGEPMMYLRNRSLFNIHAVVL